MMVGNNLKKIEMAQAIKDKKHRNRIRFKKDSEKKVNQIFNQINELDKILHKFIPEYTKSDLDKIYKAIEDTVKLTKSKFIYSLEHKQFNF